MNSPPLTSKALYFRLLRYVWPYRVTFAVSIIAMVIAAAMDGSVAALMKWLVDGTFVKQDSATVKLIPLGIIVLTLVRGAANFASAFSIAWIGNRLVMDLREKMFDRLLHLPTRYYDNHATGNLISKLTYDVAQVTSAATNVVTVVVKDTLTIACLIGWLLYLNWKLTLISLIVAPLLAWFVRKFSKRMRQVSRGQQRAMGGITQVIEESIEGQRVIKIFGGAAYEAGRFKAAANTVRRFGMKQAAAASANSAMGEFVAALMLALIVYLVAQQSVSKVTTIGEFMSFITAVMLLMSPLKRLTNINESLQRGLAAAESVFEFIDEQPEVDTGKINLGRAHGAIAFENVGFTYLESSGQAIAGINLVLPAGRTLALVGRSGSGKTTLVNLVSRFYAPSTGRITLDGYDLQDIKLGDLRANIAFVGQDVVLFNDSIAANIAYGPLANTAEQDIIAAAKAAYAMEFIREMPQGIHTLIGENGVRLSGGQRQRLAIARAFLKNAPVLILDEATSALDTESERQIQAAMETLMRGRTTLVIAHRLSTIERADNIVVLESGQIVEMGTHTQLVVGNGAYSKLYNAQFSALDPVVSES